MSLHESCEHTGPSASFLLSSLELESDRSLVFFFFYSSLKDEIKGVHLSKGTPFGLKCLTTMNMDRNDLICKIDALPNENYEN